MARTKGATADKLWADAIRLAANREDADPEGDGKIRKRISIIADKLCRLAMEGDMQAIKEIGDRLDGRPAAQTDITSGGEKIEFPSEIIMRAASASND